MIILMTKRCPVCEGRGFVRTRLGCIDCFNCFGAGWISKEALKRSEEIRKGKDNAKA